MSKEDFSEDTLGGIYEKVDSLSLDSAGIAGDLEEIKKELNEWRYSKTSPIQFHQDAITEKFEKLESTLKLHTEIVEAQNRYIVKNVDEIKNEFFDIKKRVERPKILVPILLIAILVVLLIK